MVLTLTEAQRLLLGIISSVESGVTAPEEAVDELNDLREKAGKAGVPFKADYVLADFEKIRQNYVAQYETSAPYVEESYEPSYESSY